MRSVLEKQIVRRTNRGNEKEVVPVPNVPTVVGGVSEFNKPGFS